MPAPKPPSSSNARAAAEATVAPDDSGMDALPPGPAFGADKPPPTLAFPDTQYGEGVEGPFCIPGYEILGELGRGGMGVVYKARQLQLGRLVALKMSRSAENTLEELARFRAEAEAVARLRHPNIVQIYEVGEYQSRPFFSFEYVDGGNLADFVRGTPQPPRAAAELVETLARAMHVAHEHGIIHRDLKPANVLLGGVKSTYTESGKAQTADEATLPYSSTRGSQLVPKIADFGVAKRLDKHSLHTATGAVLGTPNYMAPEQAWGSDRRKPVGPPADVYALGAILYEMLTGRPPFLGETPLDTLQQVVMQEPVAPTRLQPKVPKDLETICLKCLQKEPGRRYASAQELAEDARRFLDDRPIQAKAEGPMTRLFRWRRRNPAVAALLVIALLFLATGAAASTYFAVEARFAADEALASERKSDDMAREATRQKIIAETKNQEAEDNLKKAEDNLKKAEDNARQALQNARERDRLFYGWQISLASFAVQDNGVGQILNALDALMPSKVGNEDLRGFEWYYLRRRCGGKPVMLEDAHPGAVLALAFNAEGNKLATANSAVDQHGQPVGVKVCVWQAQSGRRLCELSGPVKDVKSLAFSPDGKVIAGACSDGKIYLWHPAYDDRAKDIPVIKPHATCTGHEGHVTCVVFASEGQSLVSSSEDKSVRFWNPNNGESTGMWSNFPEAVEGLAVHPTDSTIALACRDGTIILKHLVRNNEVNRHEGSGRRVVHLAWHPKGKQLAAALADGRIQIWNAASIESVIMLHNHTGPVHQVAFSLDGNHLASVSDDKTLRLYAANNHSPLRVYTEHTAAVRCVSFGADGTLLASGASDGKVVIRPFSVKRASLPLTGHTGGVCDVSWNFDGTALASTRIAKEKLQKLPDVTGSEVIVWNMVSNRPERTLTGHAKRAFRVAFQPGGKLLGTVSMDGSVRLWDVREGEEVKVLGKQSLPFYALAWSHDGRRLAASGDFITQGQAQTRVTIWDVVTGNQVQSFVHPQDWMESLAWSHDDKWLAGGSPQSENLWLWDAASGVLVHQFQGHSGGINGLAFSPDSRWLASASADKSVRLWDLQDKGASVVLTGHRGAALAVAFHPDRKRLASCGDDEMVKLWNLETHKEMLSLTDHKAAVTALAFRPDGDQLASASRDGTVRIWDATRLPEDEPMGKAAK